jgi:hypothetical protein
MIFLLIAIVAAFCLSGCAGENSSVQDDVTQEYVVNKRTGKIHSADCPSVVQMSEKNKLYVSDTLLNLLKQDYVVCRRCRAGFDKNGAKGTLQHLLYKNLYTEEFEIEASREDYLKAVDEISEWYVDHVPTYAARIQDEPFSKYNGRLTNYKEYAMKNKGKTSTHNVISSDTNASSTALLKPDDEILRGTENAACYYNENIKQIDFKKHIAYYPCDILDASSDYSKPGDDCVRYVFAVLNRMDSQFTKKYALLTRSSYSRTDSKTMATDYWDIAYGFVNLGFKIYDKEEGIIDVDKDTYAEGYIFKIDNDFMLQKGDILAREGHVHIYLGDGVMTEADNFGWGRVYRSFPQIYEIKKEQLDGKNFISLKNGNGDKEYYRRVYRYIGTSGGSK